MANLQFVDLQNEVYAHTNIDSSDTTNTTNVNRWLNYTQQDICARTPWTFMEGRTNIVTVKDYTTGTVTITSGSATVTGNGTTFTSAMGTGGYYIQFSSANDWYNITTFNSVTSLTIEQNYQPTTNLTAGTYTIRKIYYSLPSTVDRIIDIRNWNTPVKLIQVDVRTLDDLYPNPQSTNSSYGYIAWGYDSSSNIQISPYPFPSDARLLEFRVLKRPVDMSVSADTPSIPNKYAFVIAWGAIAIGFSYMKRLDLAQAWSARYEQRISDMKREYRITEDYAPILRSIDTIQRAKWLQMPADFPVVTG